MTHVASAPLARLSLSRVILLVKSGEGSGPKIANQAGYYLLNGRWHKLHHDKPAPKGVPQAAHPQAAHGSHVTSHILSTEQVAQLKLPPENVNAGTFNKQLEKLVDYASTGNSTAILGMPLGVNTYGKKLATIANWLLGQMGEKQHVVAHGQAAGAHPAVQGEPKFSLSPEQEKGMIDAKVANQLFDPEQSAAFAKLDSAQKHDLIEKVKAAQAGQKEADAFSDNLKGWHDSLTAGKPPTPEQWAAWSSLPVNEQNKAYGAVILPLKDKAFAAAQKAFNSGAVAQQAAFDKPVGPSIAELQGSGALPSAGHLLQMPVFTEGLKTTGVVAHYQKLAQKVIDHGMAGNTAVLEDMKAGNGKAWAGKTSNSKALLGLHAAALAHASGKPKAVAAPVPAQAPAAAPAAPAAPATEPSKLAQIPWDKFVLPASNSNAPSNNKKVAAIKAAAEAGDAAALQAMSFGSNTYGKKQNLLAQTALAAIDGPAPAAAAPDAAGIIELNGFQYKKGEVTGDWSFQHADTNDWNPVTNDKVIAQLNSMAPISNGIGDAKPVVVKTKTDEHKEVIDKLAAAGDVASLKAVYNAQKGYNEEVAHHAKKALYRLDPTALQPPAAAPAPKPVKVAPADVFENTTEGHSKFWSVSTSGSVMKTVYGKIGTAGQTTEKDFGSYDAAFDAAQALIKQKKASGYAYKGPSTHEYAAGPAEIGPKDGDTKQGADGQLVFKDGHWHKVEAGGPDPVHALTIPHFEAYDKSVWAKRYATVAEALKAAVMAGGADALKGVVVNHADGRFSIKIAGFHLKKLGATDGSMGPQGARRVAMHKFITELKAAAGKPKKAPKATASPVPAAASAPVVEVMPSMDKWKQTGPQGGSNPGGRYKDPSGQEWYCKFPADEDIARSEVLASRLYAIAGLAGQDAQLVTKDGKVGIASKWTEVKHAGGAPQLAKLEGARAGFAVDCWLANWDVVGLGFDNLQVGPDGKAIRIDAGGSLEYRAQGAKKPFGNSVTEIDTLRDAKVNAQSAAVFGGMTNADLTASARKVVEISDAQIRATVAEFGPGDAQAKKAMAETLIARKHDLLARFPKASKQGAKKVLDMSALPINPAVIPKPHDFENWNGPGKGLSSKAHVNKANSAAEQQMLVLAQAGNLAALKNLEFPEVDKDTGQPTGKMLRVNQHPSKNVAQYHADLVQLLDEVANPPEALKVFRETDVGTIHAIDAAFPPKPFGQTVNKVASNEKLGFWVVLGAIKGTSKFTPKATSHYSSMAIAKAKEKFKTASTLAKHFMTSIQSSGSYNELFRSGKTADPSGNKLVDVAQAALQHATEMPEGTSIYKWITIPPGMMDHINAAKEGTVFQATGSMCTSYDPTATKNFGSHRLTIRYAKGAKGVESFGSGGFSSEKEVTTLPNSRFVILSKKMVPDIEHGNHNKQRLELEVLMLPPDLGIQK